MCLCPIKQLLPLFIIAYRIDLCENRTRMADLNVCSNDDLVGKKPAKQLIAPMLNIVCELEREV